MLYRTQVSLETNFEHIIWVVFTFSLVNVTNNLLFLFYILDSYFWNQGQRIVTRLDVTTANEFSSCFGKWIDCLYC